MKSIKMPRGPRNPGQRSGAVGAFSAIAVLGVLALSAGVTAFACTPSNLVSLSTPTGHPGTAVSVNGTVLSANEVILRWNDSDGPVLGRVLPEGGKFSASFTVPEAAPGYYVVVAAQHDAMGNETVARAAFQLVGPAGEIAPTRAFAETPAFEEPASGAPVAVALLLGVAGLSLSGAGGLIAVRQARRRQVAVAARHGG